MANSLSFRDIYPVTIVGAAIFGGFGDISLLSPKRIAGKLPKKSATLSLPLAVLSVNWRVPAIRPLADESRRNFGGKLGNILKEAHGRVVKASDSRSAGREFESRRRRLFSRISLRQVDHSSLPRPTKPSVGISFGWGLK